jgi:hypothetical protein
MPRRGTSTVTNPGVGDVYTVLDGTQWLVIGRAEGKVRLEALKASVVRVWETTIPVLLVSVSGWRRSGC